MRTFWRYILLIFVALCETLNRYHFFRRLVPAMTESSHEIHFLSNRLSIVLAIKQDGLNSTLIRGDKIKKPAHFFADMDIIETANNCLTEKDVQSGLSCVESFLNHFLKENPVDCFLFWNGSSFLARAFSCYIKNNNYQGLYFEIGNFPGKLFVDPSGVNIRSWFAKHYQTLSHTDLDMEKFSLWQRAYLEEKFYSHQIPQAKTVSSFNWHYPIDLAGFYFLSAPYSEHPDVFRQTWQYLRSRKINFDYDYFEPASCNGYIFFPMQVSSDSQLLWNSQVDNIQALHKTTAIAKESGKKLVVKPHPAETNHLFVNKLAKLRNLLGFLFVNNNTFQLMQYSDTIVTINSTVGMEAMLCGKPVITLGQAFYSDFSLEDLAYYLQHYLLEIDRFAEQPISKEQLDQILSRFKN